MFKTFCKISQPGVIVLWGVIAYNLYSPLPGIWSSAANITAMVLLAGHLGEWFIIKDKVKAAGHDAISAFTKTLIFGFTWWVPVLSVNKALSANK